MAIVVAVFFVLVALMFLGWRARANRQAHIAAPQTAPAAAELGEMLGEFDGFYVATTSAGRPLDRISVHGLGFRAKCVLEVAARGVVLHLPAQSLLIPVADIRDVHEATWTIDRAVEEKGLQVITWDLGETEVDSYFRLIEPRGFAAALETARAPRTERNPS
jgi:hypothetical protein